jgi:putative nucleotidyltransferase with HDIG domain
VAQRLHKALRPGDFAGRYGGEEFALILTGATVFEASAEASRLLQIIHNAPYEWHGSETATMTIPVTASIGVAAYGIHGTQCEELIEQADLAMYEAKLDGRDCIHVADVWVPVAQRSTVPTHTPTLHKHRQSKGLLREEESTILISSQALQALGAVVRARDHTTETHSYRLPWLAEETGRRLQASREDLLLMRLGGLFHDIGKMGVPEAILNKPGPLDKKEWEIMQRHPAIGARLLEEIGGGFQLVASMALTHHERWDGTGYPQSLKEQQIPLPARVLSVVDAYDTMVSRRPYKEPLPKSIALAELRRCSGTQFDPAVVTAFLSLLENADP